MGWVIEEKTGRRVDGQYGQLSVWYEKAGMRGGATCVTQSTNTLNSQQ